MFKSLSRGIFYSSLADPENCLNPKARRSRNLFIERFNNKKYTKRKPSYFQNHKGNSQEMFPKKSVLKMFQNSQESIRIRYSCYLLKRDTGIVVFMWILTPFPGLFLPEHFHDCLWKRDIKISSRSLFSFNTVIFSFEVDSSVFSFENILASSKLFSNHGHQLAAKDI